MTCHAKSRRCLRSLRHAGEKVRSFDQAAQNLELGAGGRNEVESLGGHAARRSFHLFMITDSSFRSDSETQKERSQVLSR